MAPFVAPANLLVERGHDVTFLAPAGFHPLLGGEKFELATYPLDFSARAMHTDPEHVRLMRHPFVNQVRLGRYWMRTSWSNNPSAAAGALRTTLTGADAVVSHPTFASVVAPTCEHLDVPLVCGHLFPMMIPTEQWMPPIGRRSPSAGRTLNRAAWRAFRWASGRWLIDGQLNAYRRSLGLRNKAGNTLMGWETAARTVMLASTHYYGDPPADWPPMTWGGFSAWPGPAGGHDIEPAVAAYLDAGDPPVLLTLGSSAATGAGRAFAAMTAGIDRLGLRSLALVGDPSNLDALEGRPGAFLFAPVGQVLPRCQVAVVSGAIGTLAAALVAGVPVVVVPQLFDQVWHAGHVERLGVGIGVWRARDVANAVARIVADPGYTDRARALAARMAGEDGATALADATEEVL